MSLIVLTGNRIGQQAGLPLIVEGLRHLFLVGRRPDQARRRVARERRRFVRKAFPVAAKPGNHIRVLRVRWPVSRYRLTRSSWPTVWNPRASTRCRPKGVASALVEAMSNADVATKADIELLKSDLKSDIELLRQSTKADMEMLEQHLTIGLGGMLVVMTGMLLAAIRYLP